MRLALSNISWGNRLDGEWLDALRGVGCEGIEFAPGLVDWVQAPPEAIRRMCGDAGLVVVGLHALLYEHPEWRVTAPEQRVAILEHLRSLAERCAGIGGSVMVFGSPNSRRAAQMAPREAWQTAVEFFQLAGEVCGAYGIALLVEPLPQAELVSTSEEGIRFVHDVAHPRVGLHLDVRTMATLGEDIEMWISRQAKLLRHVHSGGTNLGFIGPGDGIAHRTFAAALQRIGYQGFVSLEMVRQQQDPDLHLIGTAVKYAQSQYCV